VGLGVGSCPGGDFSQIYTSGFLNGGVIPDGNLQGWSDTRTVAAPGAQPIASIQVTLDIRGGYNGDLYAYLSHDGASAVLLNRVGVTSNDAFGYSNPGLDITLSGAAANNVHFYQNFSPSYASDGWLTGTWQPDARDIDPLSAPSAFDAAGTANFDVFSDQDPNGQWTLFVADVSAGGGQSTVSSWGMQIEEVPEPAGGMLAIFGAGLMAAVASWRSRIRVR
jgi:subtilisin-like proprotein convertase family protein